MRLTTRHSPDFDILRDAIDPSKSPHASVFTDYPERLRALYKLLRVTSALWTVPEEDVPLFLEPSKPLEYLLDLPDEQVIASIDEWTWRDHLQDPSRPYNYSFAPRRYEITSVLVRVPVHKSYVKEKRLYRILNDPSRYKLVERVVY
jgi:hypothetical protein